MPYPFPQGSLYVGETHNMNDCRFFPGLCCALLCHHRKYAYALYSVCPPKNVDKVFLINLHTYVSKVYLFSVDNLTNVVI